MTITPYNFNEVAVHQTESELINFLNSLNTVKDYESLVDLAKSVWKRNVVGLMAIDRFHGWDSSDPESCSGKVMPQEAKDWCTKSGLNTPERIKAARRIGRVALTTGFDVPQLIEDVGVSKLEVIGRRAPDAQSAANLLNAVKDGVTTKDLKTHPLYTTRGNSPSDEHRDVKDSTAELKAKDSEIEKLRNQVKGLSDLTPQLKAENDRLKTELSVAKSAEPEVITKVDNTKVRRLEEKVAALTQQIADGPKLPEGGAAALNARQTCETFSVLVGRFHGSLAEFISSPKDQISSEFLDQIRSRLVAIHTDIDKYLTPNTIQITPTTIDV